MRKGTAADVVANAELAGKLFDDNFSGEGRGIPAFLLFRDGRYVEGIVGYREGEIQEMLERALK